MDKQFIQPLDTPECLRIYCNKINYQYMKVSVFIENLKMVWLQPKLNHYFAEIITKNLKLNLDNYIDHLYFYWNMTETNILDCTNYPYTITHQKQFNEESKNNVLCSKEKNKIDFEFKSYAPYYH